MRYAIRRLRARGFRALASAGLLAAGTGLCVGAFSVVDALLFRPAPFPKPDRLLQQTFGYTEPGLMEAWRGTGRFEAVEAGRISAFQVRAGGGESSWTGARVTPGMFRMLGAGALRGRPLEPGASPDEMVLSAEVWRSAFGGDPGVIGQRLEVDGRARVVVGVMPSTFQFPDASVAAWTVLDPSTPERGPVTIYGRLKDGIAFAETAAQLETLGAQLANLPRGYIGAPAVKPVGAPELDGFTVRGLWLLLGGAALVFVALSANACGVILDGLSQRRREFAVCTALGASRARLIRETVTEHALIAVAGVAGGIGIATLLTRAVPAVFQGRTLNPIDVDPRALMAAGALAVACVIAVGLVPAWLGTRAEPVASLRQARAGVTEAPAGRVASSALLIAQIALACAILLPSAVLLRSFLSLLTAERGLHVDGVLRMRVMGLDDIYGSPERIAVAIDAIESRLSIWPEIRAAALSREIPPHPQRTATVLADPESGGRPGTGGDADLAADSYRVGASYFTLYGIPLVRGRVFEPGAIASEAVVSERFAALLWPALDPLGRAFSIEGELAPRTVVGVVGEVRLPALDSGLDRPEIYAPMGRESRTLYVSLRCRERCPAETAVQAQIQSVHPALRARLASAAEDAYVRQRLLPQALAEVAGVFSVVALVTAATGLFSVLMGAVGQRREEFGVRTALGASPARLRRLVLQQCSTVVAVGIAVGVGGGWMIARSLSALHYDVSATDGWSWLVVLVAVVTTAAAAALYPAWLASRSDPARLLRAE